MSVLPLERGREWQLLLGRGWEMSIPKGQGKGAHPILG